MVSCTQSAWRFVEPLCNSRAYRSQGNLPSYNLNSGREISTMLAVRRFPVASGAADTAEACRPERCAVFTRGSSDSLTPSEPHAHDDWSAG